MTETPPATCRLDIWLWRARFAKTRGLAAELVTRRGVRITRHGRLWRCKRNDFPVAVDDLLTFAAGQRIMSLRVADLGVRRGPAAEARALYVEWVEENQADLERDDGTV